MAAPPEPAVEDLLGFIAASPSPFHAVEEAARILAVAGFDELDARAHWPANGRFFTRRGGSLLAWVTPDRTDPTHPFRIVGAHTDSPNLRIKPRPDTGRAGWRQLGVEVYGGALLNSWLDRDLGLSGRITCRDESGLRTELVRIDRPLLRIPQLAIHLDREVTTAGLKLNAQAHLSPVWGLGEPRDGEFRQLLADTVGLAADEIVHWEVMVHDLTPPTVTGVDHELVAAPRLDNLASCHAAVRALAAQRPAGGVAVICLFDHEEVGSQSATGAGSDLLPRHLERIVTAAGGGRDELHRALAASVCCSADGAHATHPNYPERHEPDHPVRVGGGPVLKVNANVRYATDSESAGVIVDAARQADVPLQTFVSRSDLPCGSTIGPATAAALGIPTADVGIAQLSMHSARELCGVADPGRFTRLLESFLAG